MEKERILKMVSEPSENYSVLHEIRDNAIMLSVGNAYLCEEPFLKNIGFSIDSMLDEMREEIESLKMKFPGKFVDEIDVDEILEGIHDTALRLQEPDKEISGECTAGELGRELEGKIGNLTRAIDAIKARVEGETDKYSKTDFLSGLFGGLSAAIKKTVALSFKIIIILAIIAIVPLSYLALTMESEGSLLKEIKQSESYIQSQEKIISGLDSEKNQILQQIRSIENRRLSRGDKLEIMDLNIKINKLDEDRNKVALEIDIHKNKIRKMEEKIKGIKEKSFIQRLLRR